ncbi:hypothetical protein Cni_G15099 [Canna indica]|uniref:Telomerase reverse transcriptase n=1 Tax=Canna indica TaxID=4628 RepID=A0AAQ3KDF9_9LILI|nr:hypothetical protein Cni_G15099 [Canna indica]
MAEPEEEVEMESDAADAGGPIPFQLQLDKPLPFQIRIAEWNPEKNLLAMVTEDSKVVLHRFNWQRLWMITPDTILRRVKVEKPELLGSSVFGYNDVYQKIHQFLSKVKIRQSGKPNIYIVVADVLKAFDSIDQDKLIGILDDILENDMYGISRHAMISCKKGYFGTTYDHCLPFGCNNSNFASIFGPSFQSLPTNSILIDQVLADNLIEQLPTTIGVLRSVKVLILDGNRITNLPDECNYLI